MQEEINPMEWKDIAKKPKIVKMTVTLHGHPEFPDGMELDADSLVGEVQFFRPPTFDGDRYKNDPNPPVSWTKDSQN